MYIYIYTVLDQDSYYESSIVPGMDTETQSTSDGIIEDGGVKKY